MLIDDYYKKINQKNLNLLDSIGFFNGPDEIEIVFTKNIEKYENSFAMVEIHVYQMGGYSIKISEYIDNEAMEHISKETYEWAIELTEMLGI